MISHNLTDYIGDLYKTPVIRLYEGMDYTPLHGFKTVYDVGNRPVPNDVTCVLNEIVVKKIFYVSHLPTPVYF